jgi:hypothetical protein
MERTAGSFESSSFMKFHAQPAAALSRQPSLILFSLDVIMRELQSKKTPNQIKGDKYAKDKKEYRILPWALG